MSRVGGAAVYRLEQRPVVPLGVVDDSSVDAAAKDGQSDEDPTGSERRHQPELNKVGSVEKKAPIDNEFAADFGDDEEDDSARMSRMNQVMQGVARQVSLDPNDGMDL